MLRRDWFWLVSPPESESDRAVRLASTAKEQAACSAACPSISSFQGKRTTFPFVSQPLVEREVPAELRPGDHVGDGDLGVAERGLLGRHFERLVTTELVAGDGHFFQSQLKHIVFVSVLLQDRDLLDMRAPHDIAEQQRAAGVSALGDGDIA
jgi:hypothetical protein